MPVFDQSKSYVPREEDVFFDDGREVGLLHFIYDHPNIDKIRGSPEAVCAAIDEYGRTKKYMMNVGETKGKIVTELISQVKPKIMIELGGYVGYSCVLYANAVRKAGGERYFSFERNPEFAAVIGSLVELAGLSSFVKVVVGPSNDSIKRLFDDGTLSSVDLMFLDHFKPGYLPDLKLCESLGLVREGTVLAADNVIYPGNPPYLEYVRATPKQKVAMAAEKKDVKDEFTDRWTHQFQNRVGEEQLETSVGNPRIIYDTKLVESFEPTGEDDGIEISTCMGIDQSV